METSKSLDPDNNRYFVISPSEMYPWLQNNPDVISISEKELEKILMSVSSGDKIFLHSLSKNLISIVAAASVKGSIFWIVWGWELYSNLKITYIPRFDFVLSWPYNKFLNNILYYKTALQNKLQLRDSVFYKFLNKLKGIMHYNKYDIDLLNKQYRMNIPVAPFFYRNIIDVKMIERVDYLQAQNKSVNVLLGNSASSSLNHFSMLQELSKEKYQNINVHVPLSYGLPSYAEKVVAYGNEKLKDRFYPIRDFYGPDKYLDMLSRMDAFIMNPVRSQALGNLIPMIALGKTVFLNPSNALVGFLKDLGIVFYYTTNIDQLINFKCLTKKEIYNNRTKILGYFSDVNQVENIRRIYFS
jgi:hypothetical protein